MNTVYFSFTLVEPYVKSICRIQVDLILIKLVQFPRTKVKGDADNEIILEIMLVDEETWGRVHFY
jgi:hypothetical protein